MINEVKNSVKAKMYDSTYTPFMGSYVLSWLLINHMYILYLFGNFKNKLDLINNYDFGIYNYNMWFLPLIIALSYVYIYPFFSKYFYSYTLKEQKKRTDLKQKIEDKKLLTVEQSREMRLAHFKLEDEIDKKNQKIEFYKKEISSLENENIQIERSLQEKILENEASIKQNIKIETEQLIDKLNHDRDIIKVNLEETNKENIKLQKQNNLQEKYNKELENKLITESDNYKKIKDEKYNNFLHEFTQEELMVLETIYTNSITNEKATSSYINKINTYTTIPKVKIEMILKSLLEKGYIILDTKNWKNDLTEQGKKKVLEIFG